MTRTLCALALILFAGPALAGDIVGNARVIDGDTVEIDWVRVHLQGIDAPELDQTCEKGGKLHRCGDVAAAALWKQAMAPVRCAPVEDSTPDRVLAKCIVGYIELNAWMVTRGYAVAGRKNACDYLAKEAKARLALRRLAWPVRIPVGLAEGAATEARPWTPAGYRSAAMPAAIKAPPKR